MTMPTNTPMVSDEYTSFVMSARASASSGGTIDHAPVLISSKASSISLPFLNSRNLLRTSIPTSSAHTQTIPQTGPTRNKGKGLATSPFPLTVGMRS